MRLIITVAVVFVVGWTACCTSLLGQDNLERLERSLDEDLSLPPPAVPVAPPVPEEARAADSRRGYLGVTIDDTERRLGGALVLSVQQGGPAAAAGLQPRDVIVAVDGTETQSVSEFAAVLSRLSAGDNTAIEVVRGADRFEFKATLIGRDEPAPAAVGPTTTFRSAPDAVRPPIALGRPILGLQIGALHTRNYRLLGLSTSWGVVVEDVIPGSPAERCGVPRGAIIVGLNGLRVERVDDVMAMMARLPVDRPVELTYVLGGRSYRQLVPLEGVSNEVSDAAPPLSLPPPPALPAGADSIDRAAPSFPTPGAADLPPTPALPELEKPAPASPAVEFRLPPATTTAKVAADEERVRTMQAELDELRRRAAAMEAALEKLRRDATPE